MKVNELMTGNYVRVNGEIHQVYEINAEMHTVELWDTDTAELECDLEPVYLTDEILEKNGFVFVDGYGCMRWMDEEGSRNGGREVLWSQLTRVLQIRAEGVCLDFFGCYCFHELQNILTVLKIGKEIKP